MGSRLRLLVLAIAAAFESWGADIAGVAGFGLIAGDERVTTRAGIGGVSLKPFDIGSHGFQFDYAYARYAGHNPNQHFVTGSYVLQRRGDGVRPFFQAGAGVVVERIKDVAPPRRTEANFDVILGAGATVPLGKRFFVRPILRVYGQVGPAFSVLPGIAAGWQF